MTKEKYVKLRKKRLEERDERLKNQRERIKAQREKERAIRLRKWAELAARRRKIEDQLEKARLEQLKQKKARLEEEKREKARQKKARLERKRRKKATDAIKSAKAAAKAVEKDPETLASVPEITTEITKKLADANESFRSADYAKVIKLSNTIIKLMEKARLEASIKAEEKRREKRIREQLLLVTKLEEERKKARNALKSARKALKKAEDETKLSLYVPKLMKEISETLTDAEKDIECADYARAIKLTFEIKEVVQKARLEATRKAEEKRRRRKKEAKYLYCVIPDNKEKSFGNIGIKDKEVYTIPLRKVAAVVSDSPMKDYETTEDNMRRHETALRQVMKDHTVVPAEFGTVIKNERVLTHLLKKAYDPARECLKLVDNMAELGVKAVLNNDIVFAAPEKKKECISDILTSLNTTAKQAVTGEIFSDRLLLNASFMVNKEDINKFSKEVTGLQEKYPMLKLLYTGPWAPYNFVHIKIGTQGMEITKNR